MAPQLFLLLAALLPGILCQNLQTPPLPETYNGDSLDANKYAALEPHIDEKTVHSLHLGQHDSCTREINQVLSILREEPASKYLAKMGVDRLLQHIDKVPEELRETARHAAGCYVNFCLFWASMSPSGGGIPVEPSLRTAIEASFGSFDVLQQRFSVAATQLRGSGWVWLVFDPQEAEAQSDKALQVVITANHENPTMIGQVPLLALDLWEHAYYLQHQHHKINYIEAFFKVVDWESVSKRFADSTGGDPEVVAPNDADL